jgi:FixJ family two-component response regulator
MAKLPPPAFPGALVYVVDDDDATRDVVARVIRTFGYEVEAFATADAFLSALPANRAACLVLDVELTDSTGFDVVAGMEQRGVALPTIFMTGVGTIPMSVKAMKAGAVEFLTKPIDWDALRAAIDLALARAAATLARHAEAGTLRSLLDRLTPREREVIPYIVRGLLNKQIATEMNVVEQTVKVHRARVMQKLEVASVADLVRLAERCADLGVGIVHAGDTPAH